MPNLPAFTMPADAAAKAEEKGKTTDFYADLTDEEREEEGLPARTEAAEPEPEKKPDPAPAKVDDDDADEDTETDAALERVFNEVADLRKDLAKGTDSPEPKTKVEEDALISQLLESDDPKDNLLGERLQDMQQRLEAQENSAREERLERQIARDDAEFDAVQNAYLIDGKPMTDEQVERVEKYMVKHPEVTKSGLSVEEITRVVFPTAMRAPKAPPARGPGANGDGPPVATIVDEGSVGGGGARPAAWKPGPNESMQSALDAYAATRGIRR